MWIVKYVKCGTEPLHKLAKLLLWGSGSKARYIFPIVWYPYRTLPIGWLLRRLSEAPPCRTRPRYVRRHRDQPTPRICLMLSEP